MKIIIQKITLVVLGTIFALSVPVGVDACDTWVALKDATKSGYTILGKNSDRPLFDCQPMMFYPRQKWPTGSEINLGRITIPQVKETYATQAPVLTGAGAMRKASTNSVWRLVMRAYTPE